MQRLSATENGDDLIELSASGQNMMDLENGSLSSEIALQFGKLKQQIVSLTAELKVTKARLAAAEEQINVLQKQNHAVSLNEQRLKAENQKLQNESKQKFLDMNETDIQRWLVLLEKEKNDTQKICEDLKERSAKDALKISQLQQKLALTKQNCDRPAVVVVPEEDSDDLKRKLDETVSKCQELLQRLDFSKTTVKSNEKQGNTEQQLLSSSEIGILQAQVNRLEAELTEETVKNKQWEERYVKLRTKIEPLKSELKQQAGSTQMLGNGSGQSSSFRNRHDDNEHRQQVEQLVGMYKYKLAQIESHQQKIDAENAQLKLQLEELQQQQQQAGGSQGDETFASTDPRQQLELLWHQAQLYLEDFQSERRDRERAQSQIATLENEIQVLRTRVMEEQEKHLQRHLLHTQRSYGDDECDRLVTQYRTR